MDIAMQECGDVSAMYEIANLNGRTLTDDLVVGETLIVPEIVNEEIVTLFESNYRKPACWEDPDDSEINGEGLEYWAIELDFVIT